MITLRDIVRVVVRAPHLVGASERRKLFHSVVQAVALFAFFGAGLAPDTVPMWPIAAVLISASVALGVVSARRWSVQHGVSTTFSLLSVTIVVLAVHVHKWPMIGTVAMTLALLGTYLLPQAEDTPSTVTESFDDVTLAKCRLGERLVDAMERRTRELKAAGWTITQTRYLEHEDGIRISYRREHKS